MERLECMFKNIKKRIHILQNIFLKHKYIIKKKYCTPEDTFVSNYTKNIKNGFYVDIGAHHPLNQNNTFLLHKKNWSGINVDINEFSIDLFDFLRPNDLNIRTIISDTNDYIDLYYQKDFSFLNTIDLTTAKRHFNNNFKTKKVKSLTFNELISNSIYKNKKINFLNIDVEGAEMKILNSIDFDKYNPGLICIEILELHLTKVNLREEKLLSNDVYNFLIKKKYKKIWSCEYFRNHIFAK